MFRLTHDTTNESLVPTLLRTGLSVALAAAALCGCGPTSAAGGEDGSPGAGDPCTGQPRCVGTTFQACVDGHFTAVDDCAAPLVCDPSLGCVQCNPSREFTCSGDDVHTCNADGTVGGFVEACGLEQCFDGRCREDDCADAAKDIYVVTSDYVLLRFDPRGGANTFTTIGHIECPAGAEWPDRGGATSHPYSMSVDRHGTAWVLYTSGEVFHVSTTDASCAATEWSPDEGGFELFSMGFVSDFPGAASEHLMIAGGVASDPGGGHLGVVAPDTLALEVRHGLTRGEYSPELSGTGDAELFAYYPGMQGSYVAVLDQNTAATERTWQIAALPGIPTGWAFARWGGRFYIFITVFDLATSVETSSVYLLEPDTGEVSVLLSSIPYKIVGAGVSTCAPVVIE